MKRCWIVGVGDIAKVEMLLGWRIGDGGCRRDER